MSQNKDENGAIVEQKETINSPATETDEIENISSGSNNEKEEISVNSGKTGISLIIIAILLSLSALVASGYLYMMQNNQAQDMASSINTLEASLHSFNTETKNSQQRQQKNLERQYTEIISLKESIKQLYSRAENTQQTWSVEEVRQLLQLAIDQLSLAANIDGALAALAIADRRIASNGDPTLQPVRQQIASDIASLQQVERIDLAGTIHRLRAIEESIDRLPAGSQTSMRSKASTTKNTDDAATIWQQIGHDLSGLVRIRRIEQAEVPLLPIEQQYFLRENIRTLLMTARLALLRNDTETYRSSLHQAQRWLSKYFKPENPATKWSISELNQLSTINPDPQLPDISGSLNRLQAITKGRQN